ncbi:hypothetical protein [Chelatococcus reniformis]|nr:hypothetical protein [Chelatococcus reniformis]
MTLEADEYVLGAPKIVFVSPNYFSPFDVVRDPALSTAEKRAILAEWASDARALPNLPTYRQLDNGALLQVAEIMEALNTLDPETKALPQAPVRRWSRAGAWKRRMVRRHRNDDDDDPPPVPARMPRPAPSSPHAEAVSPVAA